MVTLHHDNPVSPVRYFHLHIQGILSRGMVGDLQRLFSMLFRAQRVSENRVRASFLQDCG